MQRTGAPANPRAWCSGSSSSSLSVCLSTVPVPLRAACGTAKQEVSTLCTNKNVRLFTEPFSIENSQQAGAGEVSTKALGRCILRALGTV
jgi:hypothetical protein